MDLTVYRGTETASGETGKSAVCLCGGGVTGALFEVGVLAAFDDLMGSPAANEFDIYVGSSAGACVSSLIAQGITANRAFHALLEPRNSFFPLRREDLYHIELRTWGRSIGKMLRGAARIALDHSGQSAGDRLIDDLASLNELLPAGLFRLDQFARLLRAFYEREGLARTFADVRRELYVIAHDVDSSDRVVIGQGSLRDVDVATAVAASSAIPILFEPVRIGEVDYIDGGIGSVAHVDVAIDHGAERILVINPVVPVRNEPGKARLPSRHGCSTMRDKGLLFIAGQAWGIANRARLHLGIRSYLAEHPQVEVLLIEPGEEETVLFLTNSMNLRKQNEILDYARNAARKALADTFRAGLKVTELHAQAPTPAS